MEDDSSIKEPFVFVTFQIGLNDHATKRLPFCFDSLNFLDSPLKKKKYSVPHFLNKMCFLFVFQFDIVDVRNYF